MERRILPGIRTRRVRITLMVAIPLLIGLMVFGSGIVNFKLLRSFLFEYAGATEAGEVMKTLLNWFFISIGVSLLIGILLAYAITIPIRKLTTHAKAIAAGDLTKTVKISSQDEIGALGEAFDQMVSSLNKHILESMTGGVMTVNMDRVITTFNTAAEVVLGYDSDEVVGKRLSQVFPPTSEHKEFTTLISDALDNGNTYSSEEVDIATKKGDWISLGITTSLLKDKDDTLLGVVASFKNLAHIKRLEEQMRRADRMAALGGLAAGVAHEIRNPLGSIKGLTQLLGEGVGENLPQKRYVETIVKEVDRLNRVVEELLSFARPSRTEAQRSDLNEILDKALSLAKHVKASEKVELEKDYSDELPLVMVDGEKLKQAFLNIILNAFEAMPHGGELKISTIYSSSTIGGRRRRLEPPGPNIKIELSDTGRGISREEQERIFDPFYTTKEDGSGLGLSITHQIIAAHKGRMDVESKVGKGTTFTVTLPVRVAKEGESG